VPAVARNKTAKNMLLYAISMPAIGNSANFPPLFWRKNAAFTPRHFYLFPFYSTVSTNRKFKAQKENHQRSHFMVRTEEILKEIETEIKSVITEDSDESHELWNKLLHLHPADIAELMNKLDNEKQAILFKKLPRALAAKVFQELPAAIQAELLPLIDIEDTPIFFKKMPTDVLADLFDELSDENLKKYTKALQKKQRQHIISLLHLDPDSAGRIMNSDVITLQRDFTIKRSISLLQRIDIPQDTLRQIYVTNQEGTLVGYVNLEDLLINKPETSLTKIIHKNELVIKVAEDQEDVARQMHHYGLHSAPVVDEKNIFLGMITSDDLVEVMEEEASEDVYKMSGLVPAERSYFQTSFGSLIKQRGMWLVSLLILQSASAYILRQYEAFTSQHIFFSFFYTMLIGTGGNAGNQSATLVIRGLATGEISAKNTFTVLFREFAISIALSLILVAITFARIYFVYGDLTGTIAVCTSLFLIVMTSILVGSAIPFLLEKCNIDPAHSAAPFLATLMDILGILIYCVVCSRILEF